VAAVVVSAALLAVAIRITGASHGSSSATPSPSVLTAPVSTAATPSVAPVERGHLAPAQVPHEGSSGTRCANRQPSVVRVLQFNIRAGLSGSGSVDPKQIAAEIAAARPDLVSLNEVDSDTLRTRVDEPALLAEATGLHAVFGPNIMYDGGRFGNAILSRYPVLETHNLRLPETSGQEPRGLLTVIVRVDGRRVWFSSAHLSDGSGGGQSRILQALAMTRALKAMPGAKIVAGDLNSVPSDLPAQILRQRLLDAQEEGGTGFGYTIPEAAPSSRFDYILYDNHFAVVPGSTHARPSASSDHRSVITELTLLAGHRC
jgi:endonuclease/exonuclease/phosphatase family metal-dependent hydrolase